MRRIEARDGRRRLVRDPERAEAVGDVARARSRHRACRRTLPVFESISVTVSSSRLVTHTAPGLIAMPLGPFPTGSPLRALVDLRVDPIDASRAGARDPDEPRSHRDRGRIAVDRDRLHAVPVAGSMRETVLSKSFTTQSDPKPAAIRPGPAPTRTWSTSRLRAGIDRSRRVGVDLCECVGGTGAADQEHESRDRGREQHARNHAARVQRRRRDRRPLRRRGSVGLRVVRTSRARVPDPASGSLARARGARGPGSTPACSTSSARPSR